LVTRETLQQFERLQRESELIVEALRNVVPTITTSPRAYRRPRLTVVPANGQSARPQTVRSRNARIS